MGFILHNMVLLLWLCCGDPNTEYVQNQLYQNVYSVCVCVILLLVHVMWLFGQENVTVAYEQPKAVG